MDYKNRDHTYIAHTYKRFDLMFVKGKGSILYDINHKEYLDFTSGIGVVSIGHAHPQWVERVNKQVHTLSHVSNLFYSHPMLELAEKLCKKSQMEHVFLCSSGAEANEGCIKVARKYGEMVHPNRHVILTLTQSFHGRTITTLSATGQDYFHQHFGPFTPGFDYVETNNIEDLIDKINENTLAIMVEVVQGEGGVIALDKEFLLTIQSLCDHHDILFIIDEVQTGIGRTGAFLSYMHLDLHPDLVSVAKGLGNGLPIGGVLVGKKCQDILQYGDHGTTFGGNLVTCAGANVVLDIIDSKFLEEVKQKGKYIKERLKTMKHVKAVSGLGMMIGVSLEIPVSLLIEKCMDSGLLCLSAKDKLRLLPPLTMTFDEIEEGMNRLENILKKWGEVE